MKGLPNYLSDILILNVYKTYRQIVYKKNFLIFHKVIDKRIVTAHFSECVYRHSKQSNCLFQLLVIFVHVVFEHRHRFIVGLLRRGKKRIGDGRVFSRCDFRERAVFSPIFFGVINPCILDIPIMTSAFSNLSLSSLKDGLCASTSSRSNPSRTRISTALGKIFLLRLNTAEEHTLTLPLSRSSLFTRRRNKNSQYGLRHTFEEHTNKTFIIRLPLVFDDENRYGRIFLPVVKESRKHLIFLVVKRFQKGQKRVLFLVSAIPAVIHGNAHQTASF